jgi:hypothetical protein
MLLPAELPFQHGPRGGPAHVTVIRRRPIGVPVLVAVLVSAIVDVRQVLEAERLMRELVNGGSPDHDARHAMTADVTPTASTAIAPIRTVAGTRRVVIDREPRATRVCTPDTRTATNAFRVKACRPRRETAGGPQSLPPPRSPPAHHAAAPARLSIARTPTLPHR